jgi:hypothetical protein
MKVEEIASKAKGGAVTEINLVAMEGGSYTMHVVVNSESERVINADGETLHVASVDQARKLLVDVPEGVSLYMVQPAVYDEMVGLDSGPTDSREQIPLHSSK